MVGPLAPQGLPGAGVLQDQRTEGHRCGSQPGTSPCKPQPFGPIVTRSAGTCSHISAGGPPFWWLPQLLEVREISTAVSAPCLGPSRRQDRQDEAGDGGCSGWQWHCPEDPASLPEPCSTRDPWKAFAASGGALPQGEGWVRTGASVCVVCTRVCKLTPDMYEAAGSGLQPGPAPALPW